MKTLKFKILTLLAAVLFIGLNSTMYAQRPNQYAYAGKKGAPTEFAISDLTPEQTKKIKELQTANRKEITQLRNLLHEKRARLNTLRTSDNPNMSEIDKTIDEIADLTAQMMKKRERLVQDVRKELTEEQRVQYDANGCRLYARDKGARGTSYRKPPVR